MTSDFIMLDFIKKSLEVFTPPPKLTISEWADSKRILSRETCAIPGRWNTKNNEFMREIMDVVTNPQIEEIVIMSCAQIGKTELILNILGYYAEHDPSPMLWAEPTEDVAKNYSKTRLAPMLRDTPDLNAIIESNRSRDSGNMTLLKIFKTGASVKMIGANSPAGLAGNPIRIVFADEVDRYPASAGKEGDPVNLLRTRTERFFNRKLIFTSTPTLKGMSRIEKLYEESDMRRYHVPCVHCGTFQVLYWQNVKWDNENPDTAYYECEHCHEKLYDNHRAKMVLEGEWRAEKETIKTAGFWVNILYTTHNPLSSYVRQFLDCKGSSEELKTFVNTKLGETFELETEKVEIHTLINRRENYVKIPAGVGILTAAIDVQDTRLECDVVGWGDGKEAWGITHREFVGSPNDILLWHAVTDFLRQPFYNENDSRFKIECCCVDTQGHFTVPTYAFVKNQATAMVNSMGAPVVVGIRGRGGWDTELIARPTFLQERGCFLTTLGVDRLKVEIFNKLKIKVPGREYIHFNQAFDDSYFNQITAEKLVKEYKGNVPTFKWVKERPRNEALDLWVYNLAAYLILNPLNIRREVEKANNIITSPAEPIKEEKKEVEGIDPRVNKMQEIQRQLEAQRKNKKGRRRGYINDY